MQQALSENGSGFHAPGCDLYQNSRSLSGKQWQGAFFTPWSVAEFCARVNEPHFSDFVLDPTAGAGVLLIAALDVCRERHSPGRSP